jgi:murein DD-endopeptidase MepM/ murein hydrolase activator NlpD
MIIVCLWAIVFSYGHRDIASERGVLKTNMIELEAELLQLKKQKERANQDLKPILKELVVAFIEAKSYPMRFGKDAAWKIPHKKFIQKMALYQMQQIHAFDDRMQSLRRRLEEVEQKLASLPTGFQYRIGKHIIPLEDSLAEQKQKVLALKGKLFFPVTGGKVLSQYGYGVDPKTGLKLFHKGIKIGTAQKKKPQLVRAVAAGKVAFSGSLPQFGNVVIIDHGQHFYSLFAHLKTIRTQLNQGIKVKDVLGVIDSSQVLYFELRSNNEPINPKGWFNQS